MMDASGIHDTLSIIIHFHTMRNMHTISSSRNFERKWKKQTTNWLLQLYVEDYTKADLLLAVGCLCVCVCVFRSR